MSRSGAGTRRAVRGPDTTPAVALAVIAVSIVLSMSVWFSASFVVPQLTVLWSLSPGQASLLTISVQIGFVLGAVGSAATGLADAVRPRALMCVGALGAAAANAALLLVDGLTAALLLRLITGGFLAVVYPPALKEVSTWFQSGRGKALGVMIGALTIGSALPHLVNVAGGVDWRTVIGVTSVLAAAGGLTITLVRGTGPYPFPPRPFSVHGALASLRNRDVVLANVGYAGHMWELYAMWVTVGFFIAGLPAVAGSADADVLASVLAFACIAVGAVGCFVGGAIGDRWGRPTAALVSLVCSGGAVLVLSLTYDLLPVAVVIGLCAFWGFWVIADSAQFSALVTERADPEYVGGAVSLQLAFGYVTTAITIWLVPTLQEAYSWNVALGSLVLGPVVGAVAMGLAIRRDRLAART